ncbi:MAG: DUF1499 domain-containing protein [Burkholderiales bacterium]|nr:DUF1499 domain-containing protein [Burkholderiales bacterium]
MLKQIFLCVMLLALSPTGFAGQAFTEIARGGHGALDIEPYFRNLQRPASPNHWLAAPAGFPGNPDAPAPVFAVAHSVLREAFRAVVMQTPGAAVGSESATGMHVVVSTRIFRFRDDVHVQFLQLGPRQSTLALYSASRTGYWDLGTNRRRVEDWLARTEAALRAR